MGNRLTQIATRTGDDGTTGLGDNTRVSKDSPRPHAMGDVDELNSHLGLLLCEPLPQDVRELLIDVQHQLFNLGGELSIPGFELLKKDAVLQLDEALDEHNAALPRLQEFILPAGTRAAAQAHVCRTVARRAERADRGREGADRRASAEGRALQRGAPADDRRPRLRPRGAGRLQHRPDPGLAHGRARARGHARAPRLLSAALTPA